MNAPTIVALDEELQIYVVIDEKGRTIGTGTKEVCELLAEMIMRLATTAARSGDRPVIHPYKENIRSAIKI